MTGEEGRPDATTPSLHKLAKSAEGVVSSGVWRNLSIEASGLVDDATMSGYLLLDDGPAMFRCAC